MENEDVIFIQADCPEAIHHSLFFFKGLHSNPFFFFFFARHFSFSYQEKEKGLSKTILTLKAICFYEICAIT